MKTKEDMPLIAAKIEDDTTGKLKIES